MFFCSVCNGKSNSPNDLIAHLKLIHHYKTDSTFICSQNNCSQNFTNISTFKKHLVRHFYKDSKGSNKTCFQVYSNDLPTIKNNITENLVTIAQTSMENEVSESLNIPFYSADNNNNVSKKKIDFTGIFDMALKFSLELHDRNTFSRKVVKEIQSLVKKYITSPIITKVQELFSEQNIPLDFNQLQFFNACKDPFQNINTEHTFFKCLKDSDIFKRASEYSINNELVEIQENGISKYHQNNRKGVLLPLEFHFKKIFEQKTVFQTCREKLSSLENECDTLNHFVQGKLWKEKTKLYPNKILMPYFLYTDDVEINNPLGSHTLTHSITAIYYSFPLFENISKLNEIFVAAFIKSIDIKEYGNDSCLHPITEAIKSLETNGVAINLPEGEVRVYFILGLILGDNLGMNQMLDFSRSFSANVFCRFCKQTKYETQKATVENENSVRTVTNYEVDVNQENFKLTGIRKKSLFNQIVSFNVVTNFCVDIMHDIFEGICNYNLSNILLYFIEEKRYFSLWELNDIKQNFSYGETEICNISKEICIQHLKNRKLNFSAREMWTFVHFIPLMIGHLVPKNNKIWTFLCEFIHLIDHLLLSQYNTKSIFTLKKIIEKHNADYIRLFNDTLKPKHHILLHYPRVIENSGPPKQYWSFRFESKHSELKTYARSITSRQNITLTLAVKYQLKFANHLLSEAVIDLNVDSIHLIEITNLIPNSYGITVSNSLFYSKIIYKGTVYKNGYYLTISSSDSSYLFEITSLICLESHLFVCCNKLSLIFDDHYVAFQVLQNNEENKHILPISSFDGPPIHLYKLPNGKCMIRLKKYF